jgi:hypothetical protein
VSDDRSEKVVGTERVNMRRVAVSSIAWLGLWSGHVESRADELPTAFLAGIYEIFSLTWLRATIPYFDFCRAFEVFEADPVDRPAWRKYRMAVKIALRIGNDRINVGLRDALWPGFNMVRLRL